MCACEREKKKDKPSEYWSHIISSAKITALYLPRSAISPSPICVISITIGLIQTIITASHVMKIHVTFTQGDQRHKD